MAAFRHVLVATDFSEASRGAVDVARKIVSDLGASLTLVHACEVPGLAELAVSADIMMPIVESARAKLEEVARSLEPACPAAKTVTRVGVPWEQILATAAEVNADLVVIGTHGRRGIAHALVGSVAERVMRVSPIPVLTVGTRTSATTPR